MDSVFKLQGLGGLSPPTRGNLALDAGSRCLVGSILAHAG